MKAANGSGSMRERRPGVWEIRVSAAADPRSGLARQRSVSFYGSRFEAEQYRRTLAAEQQTRRAQIRAAPLVTVEELLGRWLDADHRWKPSTRVGYASINQTFFRNVAWRGGPAPARIYIPELLDDVLAGAINPGLAFDYETDLDDIADAYAAMDERRAVKSLIRVSAP